MNITEVKKKAALIRAVSFFERIFELFRLYFWENVVFVGSFMLGLAGLGGVRPFGIAFFCACEKERGGIKDKLSPFFAIAFGALFFKDGVFSFLGVITAFVSFALFYKKGRVGTWEKMVSAFLSSLWFIPAGMTEFVIAAVSIPLFSLAFSGLFRKGKIISPPLADSGFLCLAFAVSLTVLKAEIGLLSFSVVTAVFFCLEGGERGGYFLGALAGFFSGLALGSEFIVPLVISGFISGIYIRKKRIAGILLMAFSQVALSWVTSGAFPLGMLLSVLTGISFWGAVSGLYLDKKRIKIPMNFSKNIPSGDKRISEAIGGISMALSSVSKAKKREREEKIKTVVESILSFECETCTGCKMPTEQLKIRLCQRVLKNRKIDDADFSDSFATGCSRWGIIKEKINEMIEENPYKTSLRIDSLAEDYMAMSRILSLGERRAENRCYHDVTLANKLKMALELKNVRALKVDVSGARLPLVEITGIPFKLPFPEKTVKTETEKILDKNVESVCFETEGKTAKMSFKALCPLKADFYKISIAKKGEIICGDSISAFEDSDGFFYSLISDGMGSGRDAALCSRLGTVFLEKLISAGIDKAGAVSMLGNVISSSEDEIFTTVDLLEIDLVRGKMTAIKAGAAPTWVWRNKRAYSIASKTLPCGIISSSCAEQTVLDCFSGDVVIMASDGGESVVAETIKELIDTNSSLSAKDVALCLAERATRKNGRNDDISFCVVTIL